MSFLECLDEIRYILCNTINWSAFKKSRESWQCSRQQRENEFAALIYKLPLGGDRYALVRDLAKTVLIFSYLSLASSTT